MKKVETETGKMITALRDGLHGLHLSRMALVAESRALRLAGRKAEREKVWARVEEITAQIEVSTKELAEHMLRWENETQRRGDAEARSSANKALPIERTETMKTTTKTVTELIETKESPLPLEVIPNNMGINLCSVDALTWTRQEDGQLVSLTIHFVPAPNTERHTRRESEVTDGNE